MSHPNDGDETSIPTDEVEDDLDDEEEDEEDEEDEADEDEERPEDAVDCPQCDQWSADRECSVCGGRRWLRWEEVDAFLGDKRVPCLQCGGERPRRTARPVSSRALSASARGGCPRRKSRASPSPTKT